MINELSQEANVMFVLNAVKWQRRVECAAAVTVSAHNFLMCCDSLIFCS